MADEGGAEDEAQKSTPVPTVEGVENGALAEAAEPDERGVTDEQWKGMSMVIQAIYAFRDEE
jgi:hypothetical protein